MNLVLRLDEKTAFGEQSCTFSNLTIAMVMSAMVRKTKTSKSTQVMWCGSKLSWDYNFSSQCSIWIYFSFK